MKHPITARDAKYPGTGQGSRQPRRDDAAMGDGRRETTRPGERQLPLSTYQQALLLGQLDLFHG